MICDMCKQEKVFSIFTRESHYSFVTDINYLAGICYDCYDTVPNHIPRKQIRKFLERKL